MSMPPQQPGSGVPEGGWSSGQPGPGGPPQPPQNPYGYPHGYPQQGSPYGGQPGQQSPYGQPGQQPPYGQPGQQSPYGQPGHGAQPGPGYGAPYGGGPGMGGPPGPPGGGSRKTVAIVVGAVLVGLLAIGGVVFATSGDDGGGKRDESKVSDDSSADTSQRPSPSQSPTLPTPSPTADTDRDANTKYKVVLPKSLEGGRYTLEKDLSESADEQVPDDGSGASGVKPATGRYVTAPRDAEMVVTGLNGTFISPTYAKNSFFRGLEGNDNAEVGVERREITPPGADAALTCEVVIKRQSGQKLVMPVCAWADTTTLVAVMENTRAAAGKDPHSIDLDGFAARVDGMRDDLLTPMS
ncbi:hypothetical protein AB0F42_31860 [Streptomyces buecherae]